MTADQLTEKLIDLKRRHRLAFDDAKGKTKRRAILREELIGLDQRLSRYLPSELTPFEDEVESSTLNEAVDLVREFLGLAHGVRF